VEVVHKMEGWLNIMGRSQEYEIGLPCAGGRIRPITRLRRPT